MTVARLGRGFALSVVAAVVASLFVSAPRALALGPAPDPEPGFSKSSSPAADSIADTESAPAAASPESSDEATTKGPVDLKTANPVRVAETDPALLPDIRVTPDDDFEAEDADEEIPFDENDEVAVVAPVPPAPPETKIASDDDSVDWAASARKLKGLLLAPVEIVEKVAKKVHGKRKTVQVRRNATPVPLDDEDVIALLRLRPIVPVEGVERTHLTDTFFARRSGHRRHNAIDIGAPEGTPAVAAVDGTVVRFSHTRKGGTGLYLVDDAGRFTFYYAHLRGYAAGIRPGDRVKKGDVLGYVGHTGNAKRRGPHLHLAMAVLDGSTTDPGVALKKKAIVNPYPLFAFIP